MLVKLAYKNASRSLRDYLIYFMTLVLAVCIFYMFNSIYAQREVMVVTETLNRAMVALRTILAYITVFVSVVLGFLIVYANNFFIRRRKKELGVYMALGMDKHKISAILVLETSFIALVAMLLGLLLGIFGSQFMSLFTAWVFEADMSQFKFVFSLEAALKSMMYFGIIFAVVIVFNTVMLTRLKLVELIYGARKNQKRLFRRPICNNILFGAALASLAAAYVIILYNGLININYFFGASILLGIIGTALFFFSVTGFIAQFSRARSPLYFKDINMFVIRQLSSKINDNVVSLTIVTLILLLVIGIFSTGYSLQRILSTDLKLRTPYDVSLYNYGDKKDKSIYAQFPKSLQVDSEFGYFHEVKLYKIYERDVAQPELQKNAKDIIASTGKERTIIEFISLSDYNKTMRYLQQPTITLMDNQYAFVCTFDILVEQYDALNEQERQIEIAGHRLNAYGNSQTTRITNQHQDIFIVLPDYFIADEDIYGTILNLAFNSESDAKAYIEQMEDYYSDQQLDARGEEMPFFYYNTKEKIRQNAITTKAILSFLAIYLGIVFMIVCAAVLAIQQLTEAADNKRRYDVLKKLGVDKKMLNRALFRQILFYFLAPLSLAIIHAIVGLKVANDVIVVFGKLNLLRSIATTAIFIIGIYGLYFLFTYLGSKNIVNKVL